MTKEKKTNEEELNIFVKSLKALVRFVKFTFIDSIAKFVSLMLTAIANLFRWVVGVKKDDEKDK